MRLRERYHDSRDGAAMKGCYAVRDAVQGHAIAHPVPPDSLVYWRDRIAWAPSA